MLVCERAPYKTDGAVVCVCGVQGTMSGSISIPLCTGAVCQLNVLYDTANSKIKVIVGINECI